jgi:hypothetical protein
LIFVISPIGDKLTIYNIAMNRAKSVRLPASKEAPLKVVPIIGPGRIVSLTLEGPRITRLFVFCTDDFTWYPQDLREPVTRTVSPITAGFVAAYSDGRYVYAFSVATKKWSVLDLPEGVTSEPQVTTNSVTIEYDGKIDEFLAGTGQWTHTDVRAVVDTAVKAAIDAEEKEDAQPKP